MILDFEKARRAVLDVLRGKVGTPVAVRVVQALKDAALESEPQRASDCESCGKVATCYHNHGRHGVVRINCPLWRPKG